MAIENINQVDEVSVENVTLKPRIIQETPENFVASLPQSEEERDSIKRLNHRAYIQLGIIYKEKFKNYPLAEERLINLISLEPSDELKVKALYHLFRMASTQNAPLAAVYKSTLLEEYPETAFAQLISDPENFDNSQLITPKVLYKDILDLFQKQKFAEAREAIEPLMILASGSSIEPKAALLKAHINGRLNGVEAWKSALADVISTYSASEEAKNAKALTEEIEAFDNLKESGVVYKNYKWIFPFLSSETKQSKAFFEEIKATLQIVKQRWKVSLDTFNEEYVFVVVHGIRDPQEVKNIETEVGLEELIQRNTDNFVALASQYRTILKNKNWKTLKNERIRD